MAASVTDGLYYEFSIPLGLKNIIEDVIQRNPWSPNTPQVVLQPSNWEWFSQPRISTDPTTEVIQVNFKLPLSISEIGWDALRTSCHMEAWYQDRQNNWRQMLDTNRIAITLNLSSSQAISWYTYHAYVYPIVAKAVQLRVTRITDPTQGNNPYVVGIRETLIRRNIYDRSDGTQATEDIEDPLGNVISTYIRDWDASKAIDNDANTFWKCQPMPDPAAVVSLYLDLRNHDGSSQLIDRVYIDPVYTGQNLNLYYSNDDTVGTRKISPVGLPPDTNENTNWQVSQGIWDTSDFSQVSEYYFPVAWGPLVNQDCWIGIEWSPDFDPTAGPPVNPILFETQPSNTSGTQYWPKIYYDVGASEIHLELTNGTDSQDYVAVISPLFRQYQPLRIVVGWSYSSSTVFISVTAKSGIEVAHMLENFPSDFPNYITLDGEVGFSYFRGLFTAHIIKLEDYNTQYTIFQANPEVYVNPEPVIPDANGNIPSTTLDNAIMACDWTLQQYVCGGSHESVYENKLWTPIWMNYFTQKGKLILPQQISMKYLKLEFTNLTQEPYPIYDTGIQVVYNSFPVSVIQQAIQTQPTLLGVVSGVLSLGADIIMGATGAVNWLNPQSITNAINSIYGQTVLPVSVNVGPGVVTGSLPNTAQTDVVNSTRVEASNPYIYRRTPLNGIAMAMQAYNMILGSQPVQGNTSTVDPYWSDINATTGDTTVPGPVNAPPLPVQGQDWWVFPGQTLKMAANVMLGLTNCQTVTSQAGTLETRIRFTTTSVHRYEINTVTRDAAIAYFAGIREIQPYSTTYIASEDPIGFDFTVYDPTQWVINNANVLASGPITSLRPQYEIQNPNFDTDINNWTGVGNWSADLGQFDAHYFPGSATTTADGTHQTLTSTPFDVGPDWNVTASVWVKTAGLVAASDFPVELDLATYLGGEVVGNLTLARIDTSSDDTTSWFQLTGGTTIPAGVDQVAIQLTVTSDATAGQVWFDTIALSSTDQTFGTLYKDFITMSTFARVKCDFFDSGIKQSNGMWAQMDPLDTNISHTQLAYYTETYPSNIPSGMWDDTFATWASSDTAWGMPRAVIAINVDPNRIFDNKRVLHFSRGTGAGECGVIIRQWTNFVANGLFRINAVFYKPQQDNNQIIVRLRRVSDGVIIYEETIANPVVGYWFIFQTHLLEIPDTPDQEYWVELVITGDDASELYLSDLYCEIAQIRYFVQLGGSDQFMHDVTELAYSDQAYVSCTIPVNECSVQAVILTNNAYVYGMNLTPDYLK